MVLCLVTKCINILLLHSGLYISTNVLNLFLNRAMLNQPEKDKTYFSSVPVVLQKRTVAEVDAVAAVSVYPSLADRPTN